ncbi:glycoside hydrolase family protein [Teichococcus wenyumeiae]|nr:glycoside hydrolase family protein [Pseudoroseomonas wenyumeiae]
MTLLSRLFAFLGLGREAPAASTARAPVDLAPVPGVYHPGQVVPVYGVGETIPAPANLPTSMEAPVATDPVAALTDLLIVEEGLRLTVYDDATGKAIGPGTQVVGHPTIGIGRALNRKGITAAEARYLLGNDVVEVREQVARSLPWSTRLTPVRRMVLEAMAFQMGLAGLLGFKNTLAMVERGDYAGAAAGMLNSQWARQTPARAKRMADLMREG